jgi:hypothetical protein
MVRLKKPFLTAGLFAALLCPVLLAAQKIKVDYDKSIEFTKFKTYTWAQLDPARIPLLRLNIMGAIDEQLVSKGLVKVEKDADLMVTYAGDMFGESNQAVVAPAYPGYSGSPPSTNSTMWTGANPGPGMTVTYPKGTLVVELMDPHSGNIAWRAVGSLKLDIEKKTDSLNRINDMIAKMFLRYPPQKK